MKVLLVFPAYNKGSIIAGTIRRVSEYISRSRFDGVEIHLLIADNGSTDDTPEVSREICSRNQNVSYLRIDKKGRGFALKKSWSVLGYDVYFYMDSDLPYNLSVISDVIDAFRAGENIVVASRFANGSIVQRHWVRKFLTQGYRLLLKILFWNHFNDAQAGCKAISKEVRDEILPFLKDGGWFFDTRLLILAERHGYQIKELSIVCIDPRQWRLKIISTVLYFFFKSIQLRFTIWFY